MEIKVWRVSYFAFDGLLFSVTVECSEHKAIAGAYMVLTNAQRRIKQAECIGIKVEEAH